ncbi:MAG: Ig-like domain repeat protein [Rhodopirellula sp.]|nr:Ig-like domain repeat protein [Rhodopirellula sp.]
MSGGQTSLSTAILSPGSHSIALAYDGDDNFLPSTSTSMLIVSVVPSIYVLDPAAG